MPSSQLLSPPADQQHQAAHDRQEAARQAYRRSVADGKPLTGVELGRMFDRSPRWGTSRISEVRSADITRLAGNRHPNGSGGRDGNDNRRAGLVPIGTTTGHENPGAAHAPTAGGRGGGDAHPAGLRNGNTRSVARPNGANGNDPRSAVGSRSNDTSGNSNGQVDAIPKGNGRGASRVGAVPNGNRNSPATGVPNGNNSSRRHSSVRSGGNGDRDGSDRRSSGQADRLPQPPALERPVATDTPAVTPGVRRVTNAAVLAVTLVAGAASYDHQRFLAQFAGEGWLAYLLPVSVDGLMVAASMSMLVRRRAGEPAGALAWCALLLGLAASLAANVIAADPGIVDPKLVRRVVAAWPPLALGLSFELSLEQLRPARRDRIAGRPSR